MNNRRVVGRLHRGVRVEFRPRLPPFAIDGLRLWLDADSPEVVTNSSSVTVWQDRSGNGFDFTSVVAPTVQENAIGQRPAVYFDGTKQMSSAASPIGSIGPTSAFTLAAVMQTATVDQGNYTRVLSMDSVLNAFSAYLIASDLAVPDKWNIGVGKEGVGGQVGTGVAISANVPALVIGKFRNGAADVIVNGAAAGTITYDATVLSAAANNSPWTIGRTIYGGSPFYPYVGLIGEVFMWNREISAADVTVLRDYCSVRWRASM